ncbi:MAG: addiction module RelE/StbE family toxin [Candidatus Paceibacteria bacterium]|jgi:addiction module RelE/StbE family toxin
MEIVFRRTFKKQFKKLSPKVQAQFSARLKLLLNEKNHPLLKVHLLRGAKYPMQSMNITGDYLAIFIISETVVTFYEIGTHSELYE